MINKSILLCAAVAIGIAWWQMPDWAAWCTTMSIICLAVSLMAFFSPNTIFGPYNNDDIYDKDFTSLDDVANTVRCKQCDGIGMINHGKWLVVCQHCENKPVVKIDEHC